MKSQGKNALGTLVWAAVAIAAGIGLAASGGVDGTQAPAGVNKVFQVKDTGDKPAKTPKKKHSSSEPPSMTCDGDQCWWTDMGRPNQ